MKKWIAIGGVSLLSMVVATAQAEDSYKVSGTLDYGYIKGYDGSNQFGSISRSNVAFDGAMDLANDVTATAKVNARFFLRDTTTGEYLVNEDPKYPGAAEETIGLKGSWGQLRYGRALTAMWNNDWNYDAWYNYNTIASPSWWLWHGNTPADPNVSTTNASYARLNDGLFYTSPVFHGFNLDVSYGLNQQTADINHSQSVVINYAQKEFGVMLAHELNPAGNVDQFVAGKVNFGDLSLMAAYDDEKIYTGGTNRSYTASARYTLGKMSYMLGYGHQQDFGADFYSAGASYALNSNASIYISYGNQGKGFWGNTKAVDAYGIGANLSF